MTATAPSPAGVVTHGGAPLWFLGTLARPKLDGEHTGGRLALWEAVLPHGAAPPLHSHPQDETAYVLDGELTAWIVEPELATDTAGRPAWLQQRARRCGPGTAVFAAAGTPHTFRVESDTAHVVFISTPAGIDDYIRALAEPARWPWLPPPPDGPRVEAERLAAVERELGVVRHGPAPPPAARP
ncbi:cupin domain-containing protein [Baekduia soli]|uniref:Cupin domain-containing protein n=1 Tax=Baekduia soli TaxID=496014 RepID=A0A5B8U9N1_9ACTN|nr:cupin domain-containing protein [Baekduia soli]QEC49889.1 cupin domain-containing protein [Baekduia soli]